MEKTTILYEYAFGVLLARNLRKNVYYRMFLQELYILRNVRYGMQI